MRIENSSRAFDDQAMKIGRRMVSVKAAPRP